MGYEISGKIWILSVVRHFDLFLCGTVTFFAPVLERKCCCITDLFGSCRNGVVFMGAILLLEKSQRVTSLFAVSPICAWEYVCSKVLSLSLISMFVAAALAAVANHSSLFSVLAGTFLSGIVFTLSGIIIATKITSLNQFILATIPVEIIAFLPAILHLFHITPGFLRFYPGNLCMDLIAGRSFSVMGLMFTIVLIVMLFWGTYRCVCKMWQTAGGVKL